MKLYCLPYAGASAAVYARWRRRLPAGIEVVPVELPGRGRRMREPLETTVPALLDRVLLEVRPGPGRPFALFGHSMGAILAFELGRRLELQGHSPAVVFVSGTRAPGSRHGLRSSSLKSDAELLAELARLGGTPESVLADAELMEILLPVLRADFEVVASYVGDSACALRAPLVALGGADDETTSDGLAAWCAHTRSEFSMHVLPGGHFFIHSSEAELLAIVSERLRRVPGVRAADAGASRPARVGALGPARCPTEREDEDGRLPHG
jgi:surfactin synthase thioesterase subunit